MNTHFEQALISFINAYYKEIFERLNFEFYNKVVGPGMGASLSHVGHGMVFQVTNDRDQCFVSIGNEIGERDWWDLDFLMAYFKIEDEKPVDEPTRKRILCDTFSWENYSENANYFLAEFEKFKNLFLPSSYSKTKSKLKELEKELRKYRLQNWNNGN